MVQARWRARRDRSTRQTDQSGGPLWTAVLAGRGSANISGESGGSGPTRVVPSCAIRRRASQRCASGLRYSLYVVDPRTALVEATQRYKSTETAHEEARQAAIAAVIAALRADVGPSEVERLSPFTAAYIRRLARDHGIPPAQPGPKSVRLTRTRPL